MTNWGANTQAHSGGPLITVEKRLITAKSAKPAHILLDG